MPESPAYVEGYPSLAAFIASDCDKSTSIYRRFDRLSARNLLYLQSELIELEAQQDQFDAEDLRGSIEDKKSARSWQSLRQRASTIDNVRERDRLRVVKEIREKIKEYSRFLLHTIDEQIPSKAQGKPFCSIAPCFRINDPTSGLLKPSIITFTTWVRP